MNKQKSTLLAISGQVAREHSYNLINFWSGFVNIQREINVHGPISVIAHSWNPELDSLITQVYSPTQLNSEKQQNFVDEYMPIINPVDLFEKGLVRAKSTWRRCSPQALIGNARSRSKVMQLLDNVNSDEVDQVIAVRWDQGVTGSSSVNTIIHDTLLPSEYIYMANYSEIDEGYADMWFIAPYELAKKFSVYDQFALDSLADRNGYLYAFTNNWPLSIPSDVKLIRIKSRLRSLFKKFPKVRALKLASFLGSYFNRKAIGFFQRIEKYLSEVRLTGENSILLSATHQGVKWPLFQAINNHAILKYFILEKGLREKTRFLDLDDFDRNQQSGGTLINPVEYALVVYSHSSYSDCWKMVISQMIKYMPQNCKAIILLSEASNLTHEKFNGLGSELVDLMTYSEDIPYTERLKTSFEKISELWPIAYFIHEDMPLVSSIDPYYLNGLLHYIKYSGEIFIKLVDTNCVDEKLNHPGFPGLVQNTGGYSISVQPALIDTRKFAAFLTNFKCGLYEFESIASRSNLKASAVKGSHKIGRYFLANKYFPHLCTAISKGKWCTSEWGPEITDLAELYKINIEHRGHC
jgi:hypothetical protein